MALRDAPSSCPALWRSLHCPAAELRLDLVLSSGQTFRWRESSPGAWTGVLGARVWTLVQERDRLWYTVYGEEPPGPHTDGILRDYFQLDVGLPALYCAWGAADPHFHRVAGDFPGGAGAAAGPGGVPAVLHLLLQQPRRPHHRHDRAPLPGLRPPAVPAGRAALPRLPLPGGAGRQRRRGQAAGAGLRLPGQVRERQRAGHRRGARCRGAAPAAHRALRRGQEGAVRPAGRGDQGGRLRVPDGAGQGGGGAGGHPRVAHGAAALRGRAGRTLPDGPRAPGDRRLLPWAVGTLRRLGAGSPVLRRPPQGAGCGRQREAGQEGPGELRGQKTLKEGHEALKRCRQALKGVRKALRGGGRRGRAVAVSPPPLPTRCAPGELLAPRELLAPGGAEPSWAALACFLYYKQ